MRRPLLVLLIVAACSTFLQAQTFYGTTDLAAFRDGRAREFSTKGESPLKDEDFANFKGLNYFPAELKFRLTATFTRTPDEKLFEMPTSSGQTDKYLKYGVLDFAIGHKKFHLSVYQPDPESVAAFPDYKDLLLVPFKDLSNKSETYAGGRYISIRQPLDNKVTLDFNLAFNPSCSYGSDRYNCPIPPRENTLNTAITAGEKRFNYFGYKPH